jgi:hypothetical protein
MDLTSGIEQAFCATGTTSPASSRPHGSKPAFYKVRREAMLAGLQRAVGFFPDSQQTRFTSWTR